MQWYSTNNEITCINTSSNKEEINVELYTRTKEIHVLAVKNNKAKSVKTIKHLHVAI